jgi:hypothetical protein
MITLATERLFTSSWTKVTTTHRSSVSAAVLVRRSLATHRRTGVW